MKNINIYYTIPKKAPVYHIYYYWLALIFVISIVIKYLSKNNPCQDKICLLLQWALVHGCIFFSNLRRLLNDVLDIYWDYGALLPRTLDEQTVCRAHLYCSVANI